MNPFEMTVDPDGGGPTIRVKRGYVVLTREEDERAAECVREILVENARLKALLLVAFVEFVRPYGDADAVHEYADRMRELGIGMDDA